jgi:hypothetical protein
MYPEENDVTASAPGVAVNGGDDVAGLVFDNATERPPVVKPCSLGIELIDSCVKKRIELRFGFTAWFDDVHDGPPPWPRTSLTYHDTGRLAFSRDFRLRLVEHYVRPGRACRSRGARRRRLRKNRFNRDRDAGGSRAWAGARARRHPRCASPAGYEARQNRAAGFRCHTGWRA